MFGTHSRRRFLQGLSAGMAAALARPSARARTAPALAKFSQFNYSDVRLTGGPLKDQFDRTHRAYLALDEDGLLKEFRQQAGLPAPGDFFGGWYDRDGFAPGHSLGQYISGLARFSQATGDAGTRAKVERLVTGFAATVTARGNCYANQRASTQFAAYIYDKYLIGLLDAYRFGGVKPALDALQATTRAALPFLPARAIDRNLETPKNSPYDESYTLAENLFYAREVTGREEYFDLARSFLLDRTYFEPLAGGENVLPGRHAYSHVNALSSAARAYLELGDPKYLAAARNAWDMLEQTQEFASGGWGPNETFVKPGEGLLGKSIHSTRAHFETPCGAYAHFKLARYLLRFTSEGRYGDGLERVLYNTVLGAKDPSGDGHYFYYSDYHPAGKKVYFEDKYPCCSGTLPQAVTDYLIGAYFQSAGGILVNLLMPSEVRWSAGNVPVKLVQDTKYPEAEEAEMRLELPSPAEFKLWIRIPGWLESAPEIRLNGKAYEADAKPGTFVEISRRWQNNDSIHLRFPFTLRWKPVDEMHKDLVAVMYGPLMLVEVSGATTVTEPLSRARLRVAASSEGQLEYVLEAGPERRRFIPFFRVKDETYTTYLTRS